MKPKRPGFEMLDSMAAAIWADLTEEERQDAKPGVMPKGKLEAATRLGFDRGELEKAIRACAGGA